MYDYYVIIRAFIVPAVQRIPQAGPIDANTCRSLRAFARAFLIKDTAVDLGKVSWDELPCVGRARDGGAPRKIGVHGMLMRSREA